MTRSTVSFTIQTSEVNHTALYKACDKLPTEAKAVAKLNNFGAMYSTPGAKDKDKSSREHDEVISRCSKALGFKVQFIDQVSSKKVHTRFAKISLQYDDSDDASKIDAVKLLTGYLMHYTRRPEVREAILEKGFD